MAQAGSPADGWRVPIHRPSPGVRRGDGQRATREMVDRRPREGGDPSPQAALSASGQQASRAWVGPGLRRGDEVSGNAGLPPPGIPARGQKNAGRGPGVRRIPSRPVGPSTAIHWIGGRIRQGRVDPGIAVPRDAMPEIGRCPKAGQEKAPARVPAHCASPVGRVTNSCAPCARKDFPFSCPRGGPGADFFPEIPPAPLEILPRHPYPGHVAGSGSPVRALELALSGREC